MPVAERGLYIGKRLRELRQERALTQKELAELAQVSEITISELENNRRTAAARTLRKLAGALGVEVRELTAGAAARAPAGAAGPIPDEPGPTPEQAEDFEQWKREKDRGRTTRGDARPDDTGDRAP